ncbi:MAG: hypothetical protein ABI954_05080 [Pyrinomonadaceae bacterium]
MNIGREKLAKLAAVWVFAPCLSLIFLQLFLPIFSVSAASSGDKPKTYKIFSHNVAEHQRQSCASCHQSPNGLSSAKTLDGASYRFPDITDYPVHASCVDCHRQQFFKGARPQICAICHTQVSPRAAGRFAFPVPNQASEFSIKFPHNVHQDIIAENRTLQRNQGIAVAHYVRVKFNAVAPDEKAKTDYNNCTICHAPAAGKTFVTAPRQPVETVLETGIAAAVPQHESIAVAVGHFKNLPSGHESCFNCHFSQQRPTQIDCAGCHVQNRLAAAPQNFIERTSLKFNHDQKTETGTFPHDRECTACHVRITQSASLRSLDPDVPIFACASKGTGCHSDEIRLEIDRRIEDLVKKQANPQSAVQTCSYCHNTYVGSFRVPESHKPIKP